MAKLVIFDEGVRGVELPEHGVIVGRSRKADIPIEDRLLSRKHFSIVPHATGSSRAGRAAAGARTTPAAYSLLDLKSANGTFVNGKRVECRELDFDDVIEIGSTVIVFLDSEIWNQGAGLARLRNPLKAQELVQRLNRQHADRRVGQEAATRASSVSHIRFANPRELKRGAEAGATTAGGAWPGPEDSPAARALLVSHAEQELVRALVGSFSGWTDAIDAAVEGIRSRPAGQEAADLKRVAESMVEQFLRDASAPDAREATVADDTPGTLRSPASATDEERR